MKPRALSERCRSGSVRSNTQSCTDLSLPLCGASFSILGDRRRRSQDWSTPRSAALSPYTSGHHGSAGAPVFGAAPECPAVPQPATVALAGTADPAFKKSPAGVSRAARRHAGFRAPAIYIEATHAEPHVEPASVDSHSGAEPQYRWRTVRSSGPPVRDAPHVLGIGSHVLGISGVARTRSRVSDGHAYAIAPSGLLLRVGFSSRLGIVLGRRCSSPSSLLGVRTEFSR